MICFSFLESITPASDNTNEDEIVFVGIHPPSPTLQSDVFGQGSPKPFGGTICFHTLSPAFSHFDVHSDHIPSQLVLPGFSIRVLITFLQVYCSCSSN